MSVSEVPSVRKHSATFATFKLDGLNKTSLAIFQMLADGVILVTLSYVSLSFVMLFNHHDRHYAEYYLYLIPTICTTLATVFVFARSGLYNVLNGFSYSRMLASTFTNFVQVIFLLVGCFFIFKISDSF